MTTITRFFFDECLSRPVVEKDLVRSLQLYGSDAQIAHLLTKFGTTGVKDQEWVPILAKERGWIVITSDQGKKSKKTEKLPLICRAYGVTHVMLSQKLHHRPMFYKALAIETLWRRLHLLGDESPGGGHQINMHGDSFRLVRLTDAPPESEIVSCETPFRQQDLF